MRRRPPEIGRNQSTTHPMNGDGPQSVGRTPLTCANTPGPAHLSVYSPQTAVDVRVRPMRVGHRRTLNVPRCGDCGAKFPVTSVPGHLGPWRERGPDQRFRWSGPHPLHAVAGEGFEPSKLSRRIYSPPYAAGSPACLPLTTEFRREFATDSGRPPTPNRLKPDAQRHPGTGDMRSRSLQRGCGHRRRRVARDVAPEAGVPDGTARASPPEDRKADSKRLWPRRRGDL